MDSKIKKLVATVALAGAVTVGTAGVAVAAEAGSGSTEPAAQTGKRHPGLRREVRAGRDQGRHRHAGCEPPRPPGAR